MSLRAVLARLVPLALLCFAPASFAWEAHRAADGQYLRWTAFPLQLIATAPPPGMHLAPTSNWRLAVANAALTWQAVPSATAAVRFSALAVARTPAAGEVLLTFDDGAAFIGGHDAAGLTELFVDHPGGHQITHAHIHLNARDFDWATNGSIDALDLQSIALHELGHALGLAHPCGDLATNTTSCSALPASVQAALQADVMYASIQPGPRRVLAQDDVDGLSALAPAVNPEPAPALLGVSPSCVPAPSAPAALGAALSGLLLQVDAPEPGYADKLELVQDGTVVATAPLGHSTQVGYVTATLPALVELTGKSALLDVLLVDSASGKAGLLVGAMTVGGTCAKPSGCQSAGGATLLALVPLLLWRRRRRDMRGDQAVGRVRAPALARAGRRTLACAALGGLVLFAPPAHAYKRSINAGGLCVYWPTRGHSFYVDSRGTPDVVGPSAFDAVRHSFAAWTTPACSDLFFQDLGLSTDRRVGFVPGEFNRNIVLFRTANCRNSPNVVPAGDPCLAAGTCGNQYDCWNHDDSVIATTTTTSNRYTGQISDTDIELNDSPASDGSKFVFTTVDSPACGEGAQTNCVSIDVENTVTHEAGHTIGLDHSLDPTATMYATAPAGELAKRVLHQDDIDAVCAIYPKGAETVTCLGDPITLTAGSESNGGGCGCSARSGGSALELGALAAALVAGWRRGRPRSKT